MGRRRKKQRITYKNIWIDYPHRYDEKHPYYVTEKEFSNINKDFRELVSEMIMQDGFEYKATGYLGKFYIKRFRSAKRKIDFQKTKKYFGEENKDLPPGQKKIIYHNNEHSDGYAGRWWWTPTKMVKFHSLYRFYPTRRNKRLLSKAIKDNNSIIEYSE